MGRKSHFLRSALASTKNGEVSLENVQKRLCAGASCSEVRAAMASSGELKAFPFSWTHRMRWSAAQFRAQARQYLPESNCKQQPGPFCKELPLYKIVLASPSDFDEEYIDVPWLAVPGSLSTHIS